MSRELMNTKEVARYLDIHEKQVYLLIKAGKIPSTRVTGKWVFPVKMIDKWIETSASDCLRHARKRVNSMEAALLTAGSNDPVLDLLLTAVRKNHPGFNIFSANTGSVAGLEDLNAGSIDVAFSHLYDPVSNDYNIPFLKRYCPDQHPVVVNLFFRRIGFVIAGHKKNLFRGWESLTNHRIRFINRQKGSGIRLVVDQSLLERNIDKESIAGYENEACTHFEVGLSLVSGEADVGIASAAVARILNIEFFPLVNERFDMILPKETFFQPTVQAFIETIKSDVFKSRVEKIGNYDFRDTGRILHS